MPKKSLQLGLILLVLLFSPLAQGDEYFSYQDLIRLGKEELQQRRYQKAILYFKLAYVANPTSDEPRYYVNLVKRIEEGRFHLIETDEQAEQFLRSPWKETSQQRSLPTLSIPPQSKPYAQLKRQETTSPKTEPSRQKTLIEPTTSKQVVSGKKDSVSSTIVEDLHLKQLGIKKGMTVPATEQKPLEQQRPVTVLPNIISGLEEIFLNDELKSIQPRMKIQIEFNKFVILVGHNIERSLVITPDIVTVDRIDKDRIRVFGKNRGTTILHVWDDQMRWTFQLEVIFPSMRESSLFPVERMVQESEKPFRFSYTSDWNSYYSGGGLETLERKSLNFTQIPSIIGNTPYGRFDSYAIFNEFKESTEVTGYSVGLTDGRLGPFKDFNLRGFDLSKRFSPLTLPGKYIRGALWEGKVFNRNLEYTFLWGRDRLTYGFLGPGILEKRESFVQGARLVIFPQQKHQYAINYAQAYGSAREDSLKERAISLETQQKFDVSDRFQKLFLGKSVGLNSEVAFDEQRFAKTVGTEFGEDKLKVRLNFRDIDRSYQTLSGTPPNQGEIGGNAGLNWDFEKVDISSDFDVYRNRFVFNPDRPDAFNFDWNSTVNFQLPKYANFRTSVYLVETPGEISPRKSRQLINNYSKTFYILDNRPLSVFWGNSYQYNRYKLSPLSDFDRYGMTTGVRVPVLDGLFYFFNYEFSWVREPLSDEDFFPQVYNTGLSYSRKISDSWGGNLGFSYRNEDNVSGLHSFLAGEDSIIGTLGLSFHPIDDFEFFVDSQFRNVWPQSSERDHYAEGEIRWGVRSAWDLPFHFDPRGEVGGFVFKDLNGNAQKDSGEEGIANVKVKIGKSQVKTNDSGKFSQKVTAKKVLVELVLESIPEGYVSTTPLFEDVEVVHLGVKSIDFGLTTHSGIWGVVFIDKNQDGRLDPGDGFVPRVKIVLDEKIVSITNYEGSFFFDDIKPGKHTIRIDVNSFPLEYLPSVKIVNTIEVSEGQSYLFNIPVKQKE